MTAQFVATIVDGDVQELRRMSEEEFRRFRATQYLAWVREWGGPLADDFLFAAAAEESLSRIFSRVS